VNNSTLVNQFKNLTNDYTAKLVNTGTNFLIQSKLLSIQVGRSDNQSMIVSEEDSINKKISIINFKECEQHLRNISYLKPTDVLTFVKTDWNPLLSTNTFDSNITKSSGVTYKLFFANGTAVNMDLCNGTLTELKIYLNNMNSTDLDKYALMISQGIDIFDANSSYFNSLCIPMKINDTAYTVQDRREDFSNVSASCTGGCKYDGINAKNGYASCVCNSNNPDVEVKPDFVNILIGVFNETNFFIVECYTTVFKLVYK